MRSFGVLSRLRGSLPHLRRASTDSSAAFSVDTVVVGAGVVGLAVARRLGAGGCEVLVLDRAGAVASEASSRNSEVIHAGEEGRQMRAGRLDKNAEEMKSHF